MDWGVEVEYLRNQMTREQISCPGPWDTQQNKGMSGEEGQRKLKNINEEKSLNFSSLLFF